MVYLLNTLLSKLCIGIEKNTDVIWILFFNIWEPQRPMITAACSWAIFSIIFVSTLKMASSVGTKYCGGRYTSGLQMHDWKKDSQKEGIFSSLDSMSSSRIENSFAALRDNLSIDITHIKHLRKLLSDVRTPAAYLSANGNNRMVWWHFMAPTSSFQTFSIQRFWSNFWKKVTLKLCSTYHVHIYIKSHS